MIKLHDYPYDCLKERETNQYPFQMVIFQFIRIFYIIQTNVCFKWLYFNLSGYFTSELIIILVAANLNIYPDNTIVSWIF